MPIKQNKEKGFTITELSLAMSLLSVLMLILVVSAMGFTNIYNKGITLKRVNQSGANIAKELQTNLGRSAEVTVRCANNEVPTSPSSSCKDTPTAVTTGVCAGDFSFIWSVYVGGSGFTNTTVSVPLTYNDGTPVFFAKVKDPSKEMCRTTPAPPKPYRGNDATQPYQSTELLGDGLVIRDPSTATNKGGLDVVLSPENTLTTVVYTISTNEGDDIISDGTSRAGCQGGDKDAFCTLNTFVVTSYSKGVYN